jgi:hypothetical protein
VHEPAGTAEGPSTAGTVGAVLLGACAVALVVFLIGPTGMSVYDRSRWILLFGLVVSGLGLIRTPIRSAIPGWAAFGAVMAGQLTTTGIVGYRHWSALCGPGACYLNEVDVERPLAALLALAMGVATVACLRILVRHEAFGRRGASWKMRIASVAMGCAIALALPVLLAAPPYPNFDQTSLGSYALLYSLPWGGTIAVSPWLRRPAAVGGLSAVLLSSLAVAANPATIASNHHTERVLVVSVAAAAVLIGRWRTASDESRATGSAAPAA